MRNVPAQRIRLANRAAARPEGDFVLYWMIAFRRRGWNFALQQAAGWAAELGKPLVVLEALRCGYPWASDRLHRFVLQGMADNARRFAGGPALYHPYAESEAGAGSGLLETLAGKACLVVTDDFPGFFLPRVVAAAAERLEVRLEAVDANGLLPLRAADRVFARAVDLRRFLQRELPPHLEEMPLEDPLAGLELPVLEILPEEVRRRWPAAGEELLAGEPSALAALPLDHGVAPVPYDGGAAAAEEELERFLAERLERYDEQRGDASEEVTSGLSPYLHFGHISAHQIFAALAAAEGWHAGLLGERAAGQREGWWGMSAPAEAFLDELVTWRELGYNMGWQRDDYDRYESLPEWARQTLEEHLDDPREHIYGLEEFEAAETHDELWNAAQRQLLREGRIHNYLRMLWGKKILHWSATPEDALDVMIELNNKYAVDGRDPNSYSGIFWCLGRYDRPWPERPIFGKVRYMTSASTRRKMDVKPYLEKYGG